MRKFLATLFVITVLSFETKADTDYKDFIVTEKFIWALTSNGEIRLFGKSGKKTEREISNASAILFLAKDNLGNPIIVDKANEIKRYNESDNSWNVIAKFKENCFGILFDSQNSGFLITDKGIKDLKGGNVYYSNKSLNDQIKYKDKWGKPYCYFIDKKDRIWLGFGYGEWGGEPIRV